MQVCLVGDILVTRRLYPTIQAGELNRLLSLSMPNDLFFGNLEMLFHNFESFARGESGGTWLRAEPRIAQDLKSIGINLVSRANNHALKCVYSYTFHSGKWG